MGLREDEGEEDGTKRCYVWVVGGLVMGLKRVLWGCMVMGLT